MCLPMLMHNAAQPAARPLSGCASLRSQQVSSMHEWLKAAVPCPCLRPVPRKCVG